MRRIRTKQQHIMDQLKKQKTEESMTNLPLDHCLAQDDELSILNDLANQAQVYSNYMLGCTEGIEEEANEQQVCDVL